MPTPGERRALLFVATVAALGVGVRGFSALGRDGPPADDREQLARQLAAVDSAITSGGRRPTRRRADEGQPPKASPPPKAVRAGGSSEPTAPAKLARASIDMDVALEADLDRLPGIGPALAARIVADRTERGPFGSIEGLQRVKGVGPALAGKLQPYVTFSLPARPEQTEKAHPAPSPRRRP